VTEGATFAVTRSSSSVLIDFNASFSFIKKTYFGRDSLQQTNTISWMRDCY
jgi:hypothetical protein